jgi:hypothetical protein
MVVAEAVNGTQRKEGRGAKVLINTTISQSRETHRGPFPDKHTCAFHTRPHCKNGLFPER